MLRDVNSIYLRGEALKANANKSLKNAPLTRYKIPKTATSNGRNHKDTVTVYALIGYFNRYRYNKRIFRCLLSTFRWYILKRVCFFIVI